MTYLDVGGRSGSGVALGDGAASAVGVEGGQGSSGNEEEPARDD
jgi:hypothetical protein